MQKKGSQNSKAYFSPSFQNNDFFANYNTLHRFTNKYNRKEILNNLSSRTVTKSLKTIRNSMKLNVWIIIKICGWNSYLIYEFTSSEEILKEQIKVALINYDSENNNHFNFNDSNMLCYIHYKNHRQIV